MWEALCLSNSRYLFGYFSDFSLNELSRTALSLQSIFFSATLGWNRLRVIKEINRDIKKWQKRSEKGHRHMWIVWPYLAKVLQLAKGKGREEVSCLKEQTKPPEPILQEKKEWRNHTLDRKGWNKARNHRATYKIKKGYSNTDPVWIQHSKYKIHPKKLPFNHFVSLRQKGSIHSCSILHLLPTHGRSNPGLED